MFTVQKVLTAARDRHPAFTPRRTPDGPLIRTLSEYHQLLTSKVLAINPSVVSEALEISLPLDDFEAGVVLPDYHYLHGGSVHVGDEWEHPLTLTSWESRFEPARWPAAYVTGGRLYLCGRETSWTHYDRITLRLAAIPGEITHPADTFALPASCFPALVTRLAFFLGTRGHGDESLPPINLAELSAAWTDAESTFLVEIGNRRRAQTMMIRDVYS